VGEHTASGSKAHDTILVLDFGSQYSQLIARRVREAHVYCRIVPYTTAPAELARLSPKGIILSGGPASVYETGAPQVSAELFQLGMPMLGICYGMQLMAQRLGGRVAPATRREYGRAALQVRQLAGLFDGLGSELVCWMSHGDQVATLPPNFLLSATSGDGITAAMVDPQRRLYGIQFHPEVAHTPQGAEMLRNFLLKVCECRGDWTMRSFAEESIEQVRQRVGSHRVVLGLSGGVDSTVAAALIGRAIGKQLSCIFVDNGLLREGERERIASLFAGRLAVDLHVVDARARFLDRLRDVIDPEVKRKRIGVMFIEVFEEEARRIGDVKFLAQGTLYPDVIESVSPHGGPSAVIKSHHNVGGLPERMQLELLEPLRELFKDEVRLLGEELGLPEDLLWRHPFPGPGLAVRVLGEVTEERLAILRQADVRVDEEIRRAGLYRSLWQAFAVLLPVKTVGVMGDERTYEHVAAIRCVHSSDGMTADWAQIPYDVLGRISSRIINEVRGINRVVYDISSKPPATIEWE